MVADVESLDVSVRIDAGASPCVEENMEQGSPLSCVEPSGLPPRTGEPHTPGMPPSGSPPDVGVRALEYRIRHN